MVELLLRHGADAHARTVRDELPWSLSERCAIDYALQLHDFEFVPTRAAFARLPPGTRFRFRLVLLCHARTRHLVGRTDSHDRFGERLRSIVLGDLPPW